MEKQLDPFSIHDVSKMSPTGSGSTIIEKAMTDAQNWSSPVYLIYNVIFQT